MKIIGLWIEDDCIEAIEGDDTGLPKRLRVVPRDKLPDYLAAWLEVFEIVQGMIVRGVEAANDKG